MVGDEEKVEADSGELEELFAEHAATPQHRDSPRVEGEKVIEVQVIRDEDGRELADQETFLRVTKQYSKGGLRFEMAKAIPIGSHLRIATSLAAEHEKVVLIGRVCWTKQLSEDKPCSVGVALLRSDGQDMEAWNNYVESCLQELRRRAYGV